MPEYIQDWQTAWQKNRNLGFAHYIKEVDPFFTTRLIIEFFGTLFRHHANGYIYITPYTFYLLFWKAVRVFRPDLFILDLASDLSNAEFKSKQEIN